MLAIHQDTTYIDFWTTHLKAGSGSTNEDIRRSTALQFVTFNNALSPQPYRLFGGDFNMRSSNEEAWGIITSNAQQDFFDPINAPGTWHNNIGFAEIHSQSPRTSSFGEGAPGGMDDRFDFILISQQIHDDAGRVRYIPNTYKTFGNDGNHYNTAVNTGFNSSAPDSVIQALHDASDHLPIVMDLEIMAPEITSIQEVESSKPFSLFPNPGKTEVFIKGPFEEATEGGNL